MERTFLNKESWMAGEIRERVLHHNLNAIAIWVGPTGSGKSYSALRLAELVDPDFTIAHLAFSAENFLDLINDPEIGPGNVLVWDEAGLGMPAREWQSVFNRSIGYVLQSFRFKRIALFLTVPDQAFIDSQARALFHYYFECVSIDRDSSRVIAKPFIFEHSARFGKDYNKYPQVRLATGTVKVGTIPFALPTADLRESYERKRKGYMDTYYRELRDSLSMSGSSGDVPLWAWRALVELKDGEVLEPFTHAEGEAIAYRTRRRHDDEVAGILQVSREWTNKLLAKARLALKSAR